MSLEALELRRVMPEQVPHHWATIEKLLLERPGLWNELWTLESIENHISTGAFQLWIVYVDDKHFLFVLSQVITYPVCRVLRFFWASGNGIEKFMWALVDTMNEVAKDLGCARMEMEIGREGWSREMRKHGVRLSRSILWKDVVETRRQ